MKCRSCGATIAANALICYRCGTATSEPKITPPAARPARSPVRWAVLVAAALALAAVVRQAACGSLL